MSILSRILVCFLFLPGIVGCATLLPKKHSVPTRWQSGVIKGGEAFSKTVFVDGIQVGLVTDLMIDVIQGRNQLVASGRKGANLIDLATKTKRFVAFSSNGSAVGSFRESHGDEIFYVNRGGFTSDLLYDAGGALTWQLPGGEWFDSLAVGDIDGDGKLEYVVATQDGLSAYSSSRKLLWSKREDLVWHVEIADIVGDGREMIVHSNRNGELVIRDGSGRVVERIGALGYLSNFSVLKMPLQQGRRKLIASRDYEVVLLEGRGEHLRRYAAPDARSQSGVKGASMSSEEGGKLLAAIVEARPTWQRSRLYVWAEDGTLLYEEVLPFSISSISTLKNDRDDNETLLIGGLDMIWQYKYRGTSRPSQLDVSP